MNWHWGFRWAATLPYLDGWLNPEPTTEFLIYIKPKRVQSCCCWWRWTGWFDDLTWVGPLAHPVLEVPGHLIIFEQINAIYLLEPRFPPVFPGWKAQGLSRTGPRPSGASLHLILLFLTIPRHKQNWVENINYNCIFIQFLEMNVMFWSLRRVQNFFDQMFLYQPI